MATRQSRTAEEIQAEVRRRIHEGELVRDDKATIGVPTPTPYADGVTDENGANWTMEQFRGADGYEGWVLHVLKSVQSVWDLRA